MKFEIEDFAAVKLNSATPLDALKQAHGVETAAAE